MLPGLSDKGIHEQMYKSMMKCDVDMRMRDLCCGMAVYGGNTLSPGEITSQIFLSSLSHR